MDNTYTSPLTFLLWFICLQHTQGEAIIDELKIIDKLRYHNEHGDIIKNLEKILETEEGYKALKKPLEALIAKEGLPRSKLHQDKAQPRRLDSGPYNRQVIHALLAGMYPSPESI